MLLSVFFFFFQAEDGIRDVAVTGVQTCALPISLSLSTTTRFAAAAQFLAAFTPIVSSPRAKTSSGSKERSRRRHGRREPAIVARWSGSLDCRAPENRQSLKRSSANSSRAGCKLTSSTVTTFDTD